MAPDAKRWMNIGRDRGGGRDEEKHDQSIIRTAGSRQPARSTAILCWLARASLPGDALHDGRHGIDHEARQNPGENAEDGKA